MTSPTLLEDAVAISTRWLAEMDLGTLIARTLPEQLREEASVDVVAIGKSSREMAAATRQILGSRIRRLFVVSDVGDEVSTRDEVVIVGEHPIPASHSVRAGDAVVSFLMSPDHADSVLFLLSGGASSLCVAPALPLTLDDLGAVWRCALRAGVDITTLNKVRASTSLIGGGALLRHVRAARSTSLVLIDNVVSGAQWVASAMTYDYQPTSREANELWGVINVDESLRSKMRGAFAKRRDLMKREPTTRHRNLVLADPAMMLDWTLAESRRRGYQTLDMGARVTGDVKGVASEWGRALRTAGPKSAVVGVGEVTVRVDGPGEGGRCQEFAWRMAKELAHSSRDAVFLARSSDGRDFVRGVAGAWASSETWARASAQNLNWDDIARTHNTHPALATLGQLIEGGHTGWNLCDVFVALID